ncbi:1-deoxy-D-xylulose-5-phosphate synthase [Clostridium sp. B9]|uniref:1-deoxy-D-xylulose-5-phosphate synthase n=1 Tax=Clostridium sp. B9 TaxID=3423224 RepID=UPI003D2EBBF0
MSDILQKITDPNQIKDFSEKELEILAGELREFLIESVSNTGGHLASNLGVVDLTVSLFKNFNFSEDRIIWDVGHQSYAYKILTGRKEKFDTLRQYEGLCGFPKRVESTYDFFATGHSSTSLSAAAGMARAQKLLGKDNQVLAVIGDGALTGGMALEALNDIGYRKDNLIIILNDNQMSICKNVGGLATYLNKLRMGQGYNKLKSDIGSTLDTTSIGKSIKHSLSRVKDGIKKFVVPSMYFEDIGLKYFGPVDGHNIKELNEVLRTAKKIKGPVIIHTVTKKGKGYELAEKNPNKYHGVSPFDLEQGVVSKFASRNYSSAFGEEMINLAKEDKSIVAVTAAMPDGTGLKEFREVFPERFFDVGIAEQHAVTLSAGMAAEGLKPFFAVYSTFLQRAYDQVLHDVCIQKLPVTLCLDRAGIVGEDGETHQGIFDISFLSPIPNMTIIAPKCIDEMKVMLKWASEFNAPLAIRYPRGGDLDINLTPLKAIKYGKWEKIQDGEKIAVIATGKMVQHAILAAKRLKEEKNVDVLIINATFIKPMDTEILRDLSRDKFKILTVEDNIKKGGFGEGVLEFLNEIGHKEEVVTLAFNDKFVEHGKPDILYRINGLDADGIKNKLIELL